MKNKNKKNSARDFINLRSTYTGRETITKENDNPQSGKKVGKKIYQQVIHLQNKQTAHAAQHTHTHTHTHTHSHSHTHTQQKWAKDLNGYFFKERIQIAIVQFSSVQSLSRVRLGATP